MSTSTLSESHLISLAAKVAHATVSLEGTIRKRRLEGTLQVTSDPGLDVRLNAEAVGALGPAGKSGPLRRQRAELRERSVG